MTDILSENDARLKFEQLKMLADAVVRAKAEFLASPGEQRAVVLQNMQRSYKEARYYLKPRLVK